MRDDDLQPAINAVLEAGEAFASLCKIIRPVHKMLVTARANLLRMEGETKREAEWTARETFQPAEWEREFLGALAAILCERTALLIPMLDAIDKRGLLGQFRDAARNQQLGDAVRLWPSVRKDLRLLADAVDRRPHPPSIASAPVNCHLAGLSRDVLRRLT